MFRRLWNKLKPDQAISAEIERRIAENRFLREHNIQTSVKNGRVMLHGNVPTPMARDLLIDIVKEVPGVQEVNDDLTVGIAPAAAKMDVEHDRGLNLTPGEYHTGEMEGNVTVDEIIPASVPVTGEEKAVTDAQTMEDITALGGITEDEMASRVVQGMEVVDLEGNRVGKVKEVRPTDFLLSRRWSRDVYVPYFFSNLDGNIVVLHVLENEIEDQGWAKPSI